jgi:hypothetical protein
MKGRREMITYASILLLKIHTPLNLCFFKDILIHVAQDTVQWPAVVNTIMNLPVLYRVGNFLTSWSTVSFSRISRHGVFKDNFHTRVTLLQMSAFLFVNLEKTVTNFRCRRDTDSVTALGEYRAGDAWRISSRLTVPVTLCSCLAL